MSKAARLPSCPISWVRGQVDQTTQAWVQTTCATWLSQVITWMARYKPKQLAKGKQARAVVVALCQLCAEPVPADSDDASQLPVRKFASQVRSGF